ncbi:MAG: helical backbone metal receptor [Lewinella sp.]|uniref:helical backbone metal receptor n=1 Tax=Lewinella sp. TaxID=2004506 RepID=UPI003D6B2EFF
MNKKLLLDQLGRTVSLTVYPPQRIVSLVPSQTELLADLGLGDSVVGITKFCVHPSSWRQEKTIIGGTKQLHLDRIRSLKPDLIIANQEENDREQVEALAVDFPVWVSKVVDLPTALNMITGIGEATDTRTLVGDLMLKIKASFADLRSFSIRSCAYLIWRKPYMASGGDTFIQAMLEVAGFENVFGHQNRYPEVTMEELAAADPEWILLSSEPFPFKEKHLAELSVVCPNAKIRLVDGEMFSWYGSRLLRSADYFRILREAN